ncbi:MAG: hypothetical protein AUK37_04395 [Rhodobacterales bacterium CG2_30_65_12]|nr:MAG: hypothetical protein AUK37_04395 [Rhodobacterales bacterium CG2_30_65_12]
MAFAGAASGEGIGAPDAETRAAQWQTYLGDVPSVIEFSPMRAMQEVPFGEGETLRLTALHPGVNRWYLLERIPAKGQGRVQSWHFENADPKAWTFSLAGGNDPALVIAGAREADNCRPWAGEVPELATAAQTGLPYAPVCAGKAYLRNRVSGSRTNREAVSDFLRKNVVFGDKLVNLIKGTFFEDAFLETAAFGAEADDTGAVVAALGQAHLARRPVMRTAMDLPVEGAPSGMEAGSWYEVAGQRGVFASVMQPGLIAEEILAARNGANWLDGVESNADVYLVAFDLARFEIGYELGTDHPGLGWSSRPQRSGGEWNMPGPDGFNRADPLVRNGMLSPSLMPRVVASFAGGFKRDHGAFRFGDYAGFNRGHHYGFISNGVTFSRLIENLATLYITTDGDVGMKTWEKADDAMIPALAYARQNGVAVVTRDSETGASVPGGRVASWGGGNWSGSADAQLRTLRAGTCLRQSAGRKFLIYAYFSSVTPSAMARVFQAYDCDYGMLLDMNSPELTYLAVYRQNAAGDGLAADHLSRYMEESDPWLDGGRVPRFVTFSDNRDFIYLVRKE